MKAKGTTLTGGVGAHSSVRGECGGGLGPPACGWAGIGLAGPVLAQLGCFSFFFVLFLFPFLFSVLFIVFDCLNPNPFSKFS